MSKIETFTFDAAGFEKIKNFPLGRDWPVVYILENKEEAYVGETTSAHNRSKEHFKNKDRQRLNSMHVITDEEYNKSATLDIESMLIQYVSAEGTLKLQNGNKGLVNHTYYDKDKYRAKLSIIWDQLIKMGLVKKSISDIENSEMFKYSPYKALTEDQKAVADELYQVILAGNTGAHIVNGGPGTGKTILATYLIKMLREDEKTKHLSIGLVVPMTSLRESIKDVFAGIKGLSRSMVIGASEVVEKHYDLLIVDEAHRLRQRKNLTNYAVHDQTNIALGLGKEGAELDWVLARSSQQIFFFDEHQSIRPTDVHVKKFSSLNATHHKLTTQMRVKGGDKFIQFVSDLFAGKDNLDSNFQNFDFRIYDDIERLVTDIQGKDKVDGLSRLVAGFAWPWASNPNKKNPADFDIEIDGLKLKWNGTTTDWVNSPNAINEVGCIHTVQGYDLNYVGIIIGPELAVDQSTLNLTIDAEKYEDRNGWRGITDPDELERYIINIYKTLMTRGTRGCYLYFVDKDTEGYFKSKIKILGSLAPVKSPISIDMVKVPLVGSAPCGNPLLGEENIEEYIDVPKEKLSVGVRYFIVRALGDSMNRAGINDGDLLLCRSNHKGETGDRVVALLGGDNVTIKEYGPRIDGVRKLLPKSTNPKHQPITPEDGDSVQGIVQEVL